MAPSTNAAVVVKTTDGSSYMGLTSSFIDGKRYLDVANFTNGRVDVYDSSFSRVKLGKESGKGIFHPEEEPALVDHFCHATSCRSMSRLRQRYCRDLCVAHLDPLRPTVLGLVTSISSTLKENSCSVLSTATG